MSHPQSSIANRIVPQFILKPLCFLSLFLLVCVGKTLADDCTLPIFGAPLHFSNGATTVVTAIADFNNDGILDIAATAHDASFVGIFLGDGTGNFIRHTVLPAGNFSVPVFVGDFNNDGKQDLAVGSRDGTVWIYLGHGNGNFTAPVRYADGPGEAYEMAVADFNEDGKLDLAIAHYFGGLALMLGDGNGGFSLLNTYISGLGPAKVASADFNNDGHLDLITRNANAGNTSVLLGNGFGGFTITNLSILSDQGFAIGDFDRDGNVDFGTNSGTDFVKIYYGDGQGGFPSSRTFADSANQAPHAADFDGDGNLDIVGTGHPNPLAAIIFGDGTGGFGPATNFPVGNGPQGSSVADFNNDGKPDVVTPNYYGGDITVSINNGIGNQDTLPPHISSAPNIFTYANAAGGANVAYQIVAFDNSGTTPTFDCSILSNSLFPIGTTGVTCSAVDACGNHSATVSFNVTVTCGPVDMSPLGNIQVNATSAAGAVIDYANVGGVASVNFSIPNGSTFPIGTTNVNYLVTELCGNTIPGSFQVHVVDSPPELTVPTGITTFATSSSGKVVSYSATAVDAVSAVLIVTCTPASGSTFPIGQTTVNCSVTDGAGQTATGTFNVSVFGCIGCVVPTFEPARNFDVGSIPGRVAINDFNRDGKPDMAVTSPDSSYVAVLLGDGVGNFGPPNILSAGGFSVPVATGDFNQDNKPDLAVGSWDGLVWIYLGDGTGGFGPASLFEDGFGENYDISASDLNADGKLDLAVASNGGVLSVLMGDGTGAFLPPVLYPVGDAPIGVAPVDLNNDGKKDLIVSNAGSNDISVLLGTGSGNFSAPINFPVGGHPTGFAIGDFNGDGRTDAATANSADDNVTVLLGDGLGGFSATFNFAVGSAPQNVRGGDFNGDGFFDLVTANLSNDVSVLIGDGKGNFSMPFSFAVGNNPVGVTVGDLNLDGKLDIAVPNYADYNVSVLLNTTYQTPVGPASTIVVNNTTFTFDNVTTGGTTRVTPIDPATVGQVPGGFAVSDSVAYEIATTASFTGSVTLAFKVPAPISQADFNTLAILHNVNGTLVDVTATTPARDYANLTIYATTSSFSPFYLARKGPHVKTLFDQSKAYKSGSTIPIKLQILNASNGNTSSSSTALVARDLRRLSSNTTAPVVDSGNANPDYTFRYDATLGGTGGGYIFNLSTKGLASGQYVLSFYVGNDRSFFYTVKFEVK